MKTQKRNPLVALVLSFFTIGLGQFYNGQLKKGITFYLFGLTLTGLIFIGLANSFIGVSVFLSISTLFFLWYVIDALLHAIKLKDYQLKPYNKWYFYLLIIAISLVTTSLFFLPTMPVKAYRSMGVSMLPALGNGDRIVVGQFYYRHHQPSRGDLVVFLSPDDTGRLYIKRILALGGEKLEIKESGIYINGVQLEWTAFIKSKGIEEPILSPYTCEVPKDTVFVIGDNMNNSLDSRHFGPVKLTYLKGKVLYRFWANDKKRIGEML